MICFIFETSNANPKPNVISYIYTVSELTKLSMHQNNIDGLDNQLIKSIILNFKLIVIYCIISIQR